MSLVLAIGNKNYSSWSLRPWIAMKVAGIPFDERLIPLYLEGSKDEILAFSPAGKVPALRDGDLQVWDSLSILEYLAERFPDAGLWPADAVARAAARSVAAEMHSSFLPLRRHYVMNVRRRISGLAANPDAERDVARIDRLWSDARRRFGAGESFLFGAFSAADAMYAPVVTRFETYGVAVSDEARAYMNAVLSLPAMQQWYAEAAAESWTIPEFEL